MPKTKHFGLIALYPPEQKLDHHPAQKAWRLAAGCSPQKPCGLLPCSVCSYAAEKLLHRQVERFGEKQDEFELYRIFVEQQNDVLDMDETTIPQFKTKAVSAMASSDYTCPGWLGMINLEPCWIDPENFKRGADLNHGLLQAELFLHLSREERDQALSDLDTCFREEGLDFRGVEEIGLDPKSWPRLDRDLHYAKREASYDFYFDFEFKLPRLMSCLIADSD